MGKGRRHRFRQADFIEQDSPFLDLPREIRDHIYHFALTKSTPIELCPPDHYTHEEAKLIPEVQARIQKERNLSRLKPYANQWFRFRRQTDLEYVRKEMAVGLLATCIQVYDEAWLHLYRENIFRFSADEELSIARRFFTTIGPRNTAKFKIVDLNSTIVIHSAPAGEYVGPALLKNHPKLHMTKAGSDLYESNLEFIKTALNLRNAPLLRQIRLIVPSTWITRVDLDPNYGFQEHDLDLVQPWSKLILIITSGAYLRDDGWMQNTDRLMLDIEIERGVIIDSNQKRLEQRQHYPKAKVAEWDYLDGLGEIFSTEEISTAALGGRANQSAGRHKVARSLKGFGGCRFEQICGFVCTVCFRKSGPLIPCWDRSEMQSNQPRRSRLYGGHPAQRPCPAAFRTNSLLLPNCVWQWVECITIKSPERAARMGIVRNPTPIRSWMW